MRGATFTQPAPGEMVSVVCELASTCPKFNDRTSGTAEVMALYRARYCKSRYEECARYQVYKVMGRESVPADLFPNDILRARQLLGRGTIGPRPR